MVCLLSTFWGGIADRKFVEFRAKTGFPNSREVSSPAKNKASSDRSLFIISNKNILLLKITELVVQNVTCFDRYLRDYGLIIFYNKVNKMISVNIYEEI